MVLVLHLGADCAIPWRHVLAIVDARNLDNRDTRVFLDRAQAAGQVRTVPDGEVRAMVLAMDDAGVQRVYLSPISAATLRMR
ncbi:MAG: DUF370 domain-containing protein [Oscillospiraceae bacterium]|jgi:hypothetical protein|nr:DUF370 domain-containing protein [Oscillospiraceae bacterium]